MVDAESGEVFRWRPEPMILPLSAKLKQKMGEVAGEAAKVRFPHRPFQIHGFVPSTLKIKTMVNKAHAIMDMMNDTPISNDAFSHDTEKKRESTKPQAGNATIGKSASQIKIPHAGTAIRGARSIV